MTAKSLTEIANFYGTDKGTTGPSSKWKAHNYTDIYEAYLERYRWNDIKILEIGLGVTGSNWEARIVQGRNTGGASLKMWHDYFPNAKIFGIDINPCPYLDNDRISTFVADQGKIDDLEKLMTAINQSEFDFIIDDGSHRPDHQQISFSFFFKKLKSGGLYFIEDLLANGHGDGKTNRFSSNLVVNTRKLFKDFKTNGKFLDPNLLADTNYIKENISYLNFHAPKPFVNVVFKAELKRPLRKLVRFHDDSEQLCVIRKK